MSDFCCPLLDFAEGYPAILVGMSRDLVANMALGKTSVEKVYARFLSQFAIEGSLEDLNLLNSGTHMTGSGGPKGGLP